MAESLLNPTGCSLELMNQTFQGLALRGSLHPHGHVTLSGSVRGLVHDLVHGLMIPHLGVTRIAGCVTILNAVEIA